MARRPPIKTQTTKPKPPKPKRDHLDQQGVLALRPEDQIMVIQNGQQKALLVCALLDALRAMSVDTWTTMAVPAHTHPESDIANLVADLAAKAALNHGHEIVDIVGLQAVLDSKATPANIAEAVAALVASSPAALDTLKELADALGGDAHFSTTIMALIGAKATPADIAAAIAALVIGKIVDGTQVPAVTYTGAYPVIKKATVAGGNAVFQFTANDLAAGVALFPTGPIPNSELFRAEEGANPHAFGTAVWSNGNKTLTVPVSKTGAVLVVLGLSVLGANVAANGSVIYATAWGK